MKLTAACHCGLNAATTDAEVTAAETCNCSICRRRGHVIALLPHAALTVATPIEGLVNYQFGGKSISHYFCKVCGCAPFGEAVMPDGTKMAAINLNCVDGFDLAAIKITEVDGAKF